MNILLTSDWHLGKRLEGRDRLPEQRAALAEVADIARERNCRMVLVAGDLFDVATPPAEAETLYFEALDLLSREGRTVLVISGNHDDPARVSCAAALLARHGISVCPPDGFSVAPVAGQDAEILASDLRNVLFRIGSERIRVSCLSYPFSYGEKSAERSYTENLRDLLATEVPGGDRNILVAHLFAAGASPVGEERTIEVGGLRVADVSLFEGYDFAALGHIHRYQSVGKGCYCGSLLSYAFDDNAKKGVVLYRTEDNSRTFVPLSSGKPLVRLTAENPDEGLSLLDANADCHCELTLRLSRPLGYAEHRFLRRHSALAALRIELAEERETAAEQTRNLTPEALFSAYWTRRYGREPQPEVLREFAALFYGEDAAGGEDRA